MQLIYLIEKRTSRLENQGTLSAHIQMGPRTPKAPIAGSWLRFQLRRGSRKTLSTRPVSRGSGRNSKTGGKKLRSSKINLLLNFYLLIQNKI